MDVSYGQSCSVLGERKNRKKEMSIGTEFLVHRPEIEQELL